MADGERLTLEAGRACKMEDSETEGSENGSYQGAARVLHGRTSRRLQARKALADLRWQAPRRLLRTVPAGAQGSLAHGNPGDATRHRGIPEIGQLVRQGSLQPGAEGEGAHRSRPSRSGAGDPGS